MANGRLNRIAIAANMQSHGDFFQGSIPGPLAYPIHGTLNLPRTSFNTRERIGDRQAKIVVAMD